MKKTGGILVARTVGIGHQDFGELIGENYFYVDKTDFIRDWWESGDMVTLIARPRRFGKTLNMSMLEHFFSLKYKNRGDLFEGLSIWQYEKYRKLQGRYPVIFLSFAGIKETSFSEARKSICRCIEELYNKNEYLLEGNLLNDKEKAFYHEVCAGMPDNVAAVSVKSLTDYMCRFYGKKPIILLDEYDTPILEGILRDSFDVSKPTGSPDETSGAVQEAYIGGYWDEIVSFIRSLFNSTFKTNPYLGRAVMTGITRVSKESIFSDLNNLEVVTTTADKYATAFGFTEEETFAALDECGFSDEKEKVKQWYDGFVFGNHGDIYNPWSILNFIDKGKIGAYWANTSSNGLVGKLIREGDKSLKTSFEILLRGETIQCPLDEQIVFNQLDDDNDAIWSLLLASGYLKAVGHDEPDTIDIDKEQMYELAITNLEVRNMFRRMVRGWFGSIKGDYSDFVKSLLEGDLDAMNEYMNRVAQQIFSSFDTGKKRKPADACEDSRGPCSAQVSGSVDAWRESSGSQPERFYHGFVLGLIVELSGEYIITSNRESGFGRYDVVVEPKDRERDAFILEFKVFNPKRESSLEETVGAALRQIEDKKYEADLAARGFGSTRIRKYGFAFEGKKVLIG